MPDERDKDLVEYLSNIFVRREDFNKAIDKLNIRISDHMTKLAVIEQQLKVITWLLTAVAGGVITMLIKVVFKF